MAPINLKPDHSMPVVFNLPLPAFLLVDGKCLLHCAALFALAGVFLYVLLLIPGWRNRCVKAEFNSEREIAAPEKHHRMDIAQRGFS